MYDLVLRNGTVIDPARGLHGRREVAVAGGRIAALLDAGAEAPAKKTIDMAGMYVVPGLIDMHVHAFEGVIHFGVDIDALCLARGVTTALDLGSCGALMLDGLRRYVLDVCRTRLFTLCHISAKGMLGSLREMPQIGDLDDLRYADPAFCAKAIEAHRDKALGVKVRLTDVLADGGKNELPGLLRAREAADQARVPLVVHIPDSTLTLERILQVMKPGDMLTHIYHGRRCGTLDPQGRVWPLLREKVAGGLWLDVGHGVGSFCWKTARRALGEGLLPHFISSDLHRYNVHGPVFDLVTTMDKFLHLGMNLDEVIARTTTIPAKFLKLDHEIGTLSPGAAADVTVLQLIDGEYALTDTMGVTEIGRRHLEPRVVLLAGQPVGVLPRSCGALQTA